MATVFIIPGFHESRKNAIYSRIGREFAQHKIHVKIVVPTWKNHTMSEYIQEVDSQLPEMTLQDYILGFSFGAYISLALSARRKFRHQFLCSVSPYFSEYDQQILKSWRKYLGKKRMQDLLTYRLQKLASKVSSPTSIFIGSTEGALMNDVARDVGSRVKTKSRMSVVDGVGHKIRDQRYFDAVRTEIHRVVKKHR